MAGRRPQLQAPDDSTLETYYGMVKTPHDAILLFEACRLGWLPRVQRRLSEKERQRIRSGSIFVWDEKEAGMRRWTDGKSWSASRVAGSFLAYREMEGKKSTGALSGGNKRANGKAGPDSDPNSVPGFDPNSVSGSIPDSVPDSGPIDEKDQGSTESPSPPKLPEIEAYSYSAGGLNKQSFSMSNADGHNLHLISYYRTEDIQHLRLPSEDPQFLAIKIPPNMYPESNASQVSRPVTMQGPMQAQPAYAPPPHLSNPQLCMAPYPQPGPAWPPSPAGTPPSYGPAYHQPPPPQHAPHPQDRAYYHSPHHQYAEHGQHPQHAQHLPHGQHGQHPQHAQYPPHGQHAQHAQHAQPYPPRSALPYPHQPSPINPYARPNELPQLPLSHPYSSPPRVLPYPPPLAAQPYSYWHSPPLPPAHAAPERPSATLDAQSPYNRDLQATAQRAMPFLDPRLETLNATRESQLKRGRDSEAEDSAPTRKSRRTLTPSPTGRRSPDGRATVLPSDKTKVTINSLIDSPDPVSSEDAAASPSGPPSGMPANGASSGSGQAVATQVLDYMRYPRR